MHKNILEKGVKEMKKIVSLALVLVLVLAAFAFVACDTKENNDNKDNNDAATTPAEKTYNLAIGVVVTPSLASNKVSETVATIVTDADNKIVLCKIDCVEYTAQYDDAGALVTTAPTSKVALGDHYVMPAGSWATQVSNLEKFVVGKTQAEAAAAVVNGYAADADLKASCSFYIGDLAKAIDNAFKSEHKVSFTSTATAFTAGLSVVGAVKDSSTDDAKNATYTATFGSAILVDGKVVASILDTAEAQLVGITEEGADSVAFAGTKREQGDAYAMTSGAWYAQADAYAKSAVGKSASDIATLATEGVAGCTMPYSTYDFKAVLESAVKAAK